MTDQLDIQKLTEIAEESLIAGLGVQFPWLEELEVPIKAVYEYIDAEEITPLRTRLEKAERALRYARERRETAEKEQKRAEKVAERERTVAKTLTKKSELLEALLIASEEPEGDGFMIPTRIDWISNIRRVRDECLKLRD